MTEAPEKDAAAPRRKRRSQAEIMAAMRASLREEIKAEMAKAASPEAAAAQAAAAIAAVEGDVGAAVRAAPNMPAGRVWIVLSENPNIPRGGQFFGINGAGFLLKAGRKAYVPQGIIDILEAAVEDIPDVDPDTLQIVGWRQRLRYPYSLSTPA